MLTRLLIPSHQKTPESQTQYYCYALQFPHKTVLLKAPVHFNEEGLWKLILNLQLVKPLATVSFAHPIVFNGFTLEKLDWEWLMSKLSGLKSIDTGKELDFIYTKLYTSFFSVLNLNSLLDLEQIKQWVHHSLSNRLSSYQTLFTLFHLLEKKINIAELVSKRVYQSFLEEIEPFKESLENDKNWEMLSVFISNYHFTEFIRKKSLFPIFDQFLQEIQKESLERVLIQNGLSKIIRKLIDPKDLVLFFGQFNDAEISKSFDSLEWENFKAFVSSRTYERIKENIWNHYEAGKAYQTRRLILKKLIEFVLKKTPPYYFFNKAFELKSLLNLIFDLTGPVYAAISIKENEVLQKNILPYLTPFRKSFIQQFMDGKIKKRGGISNIERETAAARLNFYLAAAMLLKDSWFLLD